MTMLNRLLALCTLLVLSTCVYAQAPRISYTEPERDDSRRTQFEIIGKVSNNFLVYKNNRNDNAICVYDNDMKLKERVPLNYITDRTINIDFVPYANFVYMVYQFQRRN